MSNARKLLTLAATHSVLMVLATTASFAGEFKIGQRLVTVERAPLMDGRNTRLFVPSGSRLVASNVRGKWVSVVVERDGQNVTGWIGEEYLVRDTDGLQLHYSDQDKLKHGTATKYSVPRNSAVLISITSTRPIDAFVVSTEGLANFKFVMKNGHGQMQSQRRKRNFYSTQLEWTPPSDQQFHLLVDNSTFPDGGANPFGDAQITVRIWKAVPTLADPQSGLGLVLGRISLRFSGYEGRHERYAGPLTVQLAHKTKGQKDEDAQVIEIPVSAEGWFAHGNLLPERHYWIKMVKGRDFSVKPSFRISGPFDVSEIEGKQMLVKDVGHFEFAVVKDGNVQCRLSSPTFNVRNNSNGRNQIQFSDTSPLERHRWFESKHPASDWTPLVREHRQHLERKREDDEPEAAPTPPVVKVTRTRGRHNIRLRLSASHPA